MTTAAEHIQTAEVTVAVRSAQVNGLRVEEGQVIGLLNGELKAANATIEGVVERLLQQMRAKEYDIITVYYGEATTSAESQHLAAWIREHYPDQEVEVVDGGQPHYQYIISAE